MNLIWDTTDHYSNYPEEIKKVYKKNFNKYFNQFTNWIDNISKDNSSNLSWWLSTVASRDERESNLYHYLCVYLTLKDNKNKYCLNLIIVNSSVFKKILIRDFGKVYLINVKKAYFFKEKLFFKNLFFYFFQFLLIKIIFFKKKLKSKLVLVGTYIINKKNYNFYGNFYKTENKNILLVPIFTNISLKNFFFYISNLNNKNNFLFRENYLRFIDIFYAFFFNSKVNFYNKNFFFLNKFDFSNIIFEEMKTNRYSRSVLQGHLNYFFFRRIKANNVSITKFINSFENQIPDKGWNLGINKYYSEVLNIGHQSVSYHPQFQNLYPTNSEYNSKVLPNNVYLNGSFFIKERNKFCKKIKFHLAKDFKFKKIKKVKKDIEILILLSGIKPHDIQLLSIIIKNYNYFQKKKNLCLFQISSNFRI